MILILNGTFGEGGPSPWAGLTSGLERFVSHAARWSCRRRSTGPEASLASSPRSFSAPGPRLERIWKRLMRALEGGLHRENMYRAQGGPRGQLLAASGRRTQAPAARRPETWYSGGRRNHRNPDDDCETGAPVSPPRL